MTQQATAKALRNASDEQLAETYRASDEGARLVTAELQRRERSARDAARWARVEHAWALAMHAEFLLAEEHYAGNLVNKAGVAAGVSAWSLWTGTAAHARRYASWEMLHRFWAEGRCDRCGADHRRLSLTAFRQQMRDSERAERERAETEGYAVGAETADAA